MPGPRFFTVVSLAVLSFLLSQAKPGAAQSSAGDQPTGHSALLARPLEGSISQLSAPSTAPTLAELEGGLWLLFLQRFGLRAWQGRSEFGAGEHVALPRGTPKLRWRG